MKPSTIVFWDYQHSQFYFEEEILASLWENSVNIIASSKPYSFLHGIISDPIREDLLSNLIQSSKSHFIFHVSRIPKADTSNSLIKVSTSSSCVHRSMIVESDNRVVQRIFGLIYLCTTPFPPYPCMSFNPTQLTVRICHATMTFMAGKASSQVAQTCFAIFFWAEREVF